MTDTLTIDGKEFKLEDLDKNQKYYYMQIQLTDKKASDLKLELDQITGSNLFFKDQLAKSLMTKEEA
jgi:hypothetical protein